MALGKGLGSLIPNKPKMDSGREIPLSSIKATSQQPRKQFDETALKELADSIRIHGIVQPVLVAEQINGLYELVAGERRVRAAKMAGLVAVPAVVRELKDQQKLELALIENIQRENLNPLEEAYAFERLVNEFKLSPADVSKRVGKALSTVSNTIRLLKLPQPVQKALTDGSLSMGKARALLGLKDEHAILGAFASMQGRKVSVRDVERSILERKTKTHGTINRDPVLFSYEETVRKALGTKVTITEKKGKGKIILEYFSKDELKRLVGQLRKTAE